MPAKYQQHPDFQFVTFQLVGQCDFAQLVDTFEFIAQLPPVLIPNQHKVLWDMSQLTQSDITFASARALALRLERGFSGVTPQPSMRVLYAPGEFAFGMARLLERSMQENLNIDRSVHDSFDAACDALSMDCDTVQMLLDRPHHIFQ